MRRKLVIGNWKMNGNRAANAALLSGIVSGLKDVNDRADCAVCVPAPYLAQCEQELNATPVAWGGQDLSIHASGAYTGEVAASMLADFGAQYVLVGHSERRAYHGETNQLVAQKALVALAAGLIPVICVGETLDDREAGNTETVICAQLQAALEVISAEQLHHVVLAYEPVWAIGTGKTATPQMAQEAHHFLRGCVAQKSAQVAEKIQILYGGSMKPDNARELLAQADIDGGLIGGAALKAADFLAIIHA